MFEPGNQFSKKAEDQLSQAPNAVRVRRYKAKLKVREEEARAETAAQARRRRESLVAKYGEERVAARDRANALYLLGHSVRHFLNDCPFVEDGDCVIANEFELVLVSEDKIEEHISALAWVDHHYFKDPDLPSYWDGGARYAPGFVETYFRDQWARYRGDEVQSDRDWAREHPRTYVRTPADEIAKIEVGSIVNRNPVRIPLRYRPDDELRDGTDYEVARIESPYVFVYTPYLRHMKNQSYTEKLNSDSIHLAAPDKQNLEISEPEHTPSPIVTAPPQRPVIPVRIWDALQQMQAAQENQSGSSTK
jgi:hypothetical protein